MSFFLFFYISIYGHIRTDLGVFNLCLVIGRGEGATFKSRLRRLTRATSGWHEASAKKSVILHALGAIP